MRDGLSKGKSKSLCKRVGKTCIGRVPQKARWSRLDCVSSGEIAGKSTFFVFVVTFWADLSCLDFVFS